MGGCFRREPSNYDLLGARRRSTSRNRPNFCQTEIHHVSSVVLHFCYNVSLSVYA